MCLYPLGWKQLHTIIDIFYFSIFFFSSLRCGRFLTYGMILVCFVWHRCFLFVLFISSRLKPEPKVCTCMYSIILSRHTAVHGFEGAPSSHTHTINHATYLDPSANWHTIHARHSGDCAIPQINSKTVDEEQRRSRSG